MRQQAHPSEEVIGRVTRNLTLDRRYRLPRPQAAPRPPSFAGIEVGTLDDAIQILAGGLIIGGTFFGLMSAAGGYGPSIFWSLISIGVGTMLEGLRIMVVAK